MLKSSSSYVSLDVLFSVEAEAETEAEVEVARPIWTASPSGLDTACLGRRKSIKWSCSASAKVKTASYLIG